MRPRSVNAAEARTHATFGTVAGNAALSPRELQAWLGHADFKTTERYWHYRSRGDEAGRLDGAFAASGLQASDVPAAATAFRTDATGDEETASQVSVSAEPGGTA